MIQLLCGCGSASLALLLQPLHRHSHFLSPPSPSGCCFGRNKHVPTATRLHWAPSAHRSAVVPFAAVACPALSQQPCLCIPRRHSLAKDRLRLPTRHGKQEAGPRGGRCLLVLQDGRRRRVLDGPGPAQVHKGACVRVSRLTCVHDVAMAAVNKASITALRVRVRVQPPPAWPSPPTELKARASVKSSSHTQLFQLRCSAPQLGSPPHTHLLLYTLPPWWRVYPACLVLLHTLPACRRAYPACLPAHHQGPPHPVPRVLRRLQLRRRGHAPERHE